MVTAESLFRELFLPVYPADIAADLASARAEDANPANNPSVLAHLVDAAERFSVLAKQHLPSDPDCDFSAASVHRLGQLLTRSWRDQWMSSDPEALRMFLVHASAYLGEVVVRNFGGRWLVRRPLWESKVELDSRAGTAELSPFWWLLNSLEEQQIDKLMLGARFAAYVEAPTSEVSALEPICDAERRLPRLAKSVRYDVLYKHLRAHLPELRDLGADFPSPERFAAYKFRSLDLTLCEGGRLLLMHGPTEGGLTMLWLSKQGFLRSMFVPCESAPAPKVEFGRESTSQGEVDTLTFEVQRDGRLVRHQMLVWGGA